MKGKLLNSLRCAGVAALVILASVVLLQAPAVAGTQALKPCRVVGIKTEVQCGVLARALDPALPTGQQIDVHYMVVPALARRKRSDSIFFFAGGPGQSAIKVAPVLLQQFARLNNRRDLVFVDQRGTGRSAPLLCEDNRRDSMAVQLDAGLREAALAQCLAQLKKLPYGDLRHFTTVQAMQDLDAVREALGASSINLIAASYGTRAALDYMRQFPDSVRRSVLDGVAPPDMVLPLSVLGDGQAALEALLLACEKEAACAKMHPNLRATWGQLLASLPQTVRLAQPLTGQLESLQMTREAVLSLVRQPLYSPLASSALPLAISEAARGRWEALFGLGYSAEPSGAGDLAMGMHFSVICAEDYPRMTAPAQAPAKDFGSDFAHSYERICADWPKAVMPAAFYTMPVASAPVLLLSGGLDPVTPPRHAARVAQALGAKAQQVVVTNAGHGVMTLPCMRDVLLRFIDAEEDAQAAAVDSSCVRRVPRPSAFVPLLQGSLDAIKARSGVAP
jgi:pimeloyl-ACP methyl ester carboxylesterase